MTMIKDGTKTLETTVVSLNILSHQLPVVAETNSENPRSHYSDSWSNPKRQNMVQFVSPAEWRSVCARTIQV